ncbi:hypothetical protein [Acinetobacter sp.]|uniref:hypothetical protein n=1 Tax=Acinetobacter sp. TaxID=472 RepID=UPI002589AB4B|nr:hypothetical protein [Acinetobacter sp.]
MEQKIIDLLCEIPDNVDYTDVAEDLDLEDIPEIRIKQLRELLTNSDVYIQFQAAKLLTFWGDDYGFKALTSLFDNNKLSSFVDHRLYGYDDTLQHVLRALIRYWADKYDQGLGEAAREKLFPYIARIIEAANTKPFVIDSLFRLITEENFEEYIPFLKEHLVAIIEHPEIHRWKIHDVIELLLKIDPDFVNELLLKKGKTLQDFNF